MAADIAGVRYAARSERISCLYRFRTKMQANNSNSYGPQGGSPETQGRQCRSQQALQSLAHADAVWGRIPKIAAGLLGIFLGTLGVHNFYLGYTGKAVAQLLPTVIGWIITFIRSFRQYGAFVEGIIILCLNSGSPWYRTQQAKQLRD